MRAADRVAAAPDPDGGAADAARLRQTVRDVPRALRRPPHYHKEEEGALQKGDMSPDLQYLALVFLSNLLTGLGWLGFITSHGLLEYEVKKLRSPAICGLSSFVV